MYQDPRRNHRDRQLIKQKAERDQGSNDNDHGILRQIARIGSNLRVPDFERLGGIERGRRS